MHVPSMKLSFLVLTISFVIRHGVTAMRRYGGVEKSSDD